MKEYNKVTPKPPVLDRGDEVDAEPTKTKSVLDYEVTPHKKSFLERLSGGITGYLTTEIVIPAIKNIIVESVTSGINMAVFKETTPRSYGSGSGPSRYNKRDYTKNYDRSTYRPAENRSPKVRASNRVDDYIIRDREEALEVIHSLIGFASRYGSASVADYYDLINVETTYTDGSYGWMEEDIRHVTIRPVNGGYLINLPKPVAINN